MMTLPYGSTSCVKVSKRFWDEPTLSLDRLP